MYTRKKPAILTEFRTWTPNGVEFRKTKNSVFSSSRDVSIEYKKFRKKSVPDIEVGGSKKWHKVELNVFRVLYKTRPVDSVLSTTKL